MRKRNERGQYAKEAPKADAPKDHKSTTKSTPASRMGIHEAGHPRPSNLNDAVNHSEPQAEAQERSEVPEGIVLSIDGTAEIIAPDGLQVKATGDMLISSKGGFQIKAKGEVQITAPSIGKAQDIN